jgi:hypothetical protein
VVINLSQEMSIFSLLRNFPECLNSISVEIKVSNDGRDGLVPASNFRLKQKRAVTMALPVL